MPDIFVAGAPAVARAWSVVLRALGWEALIAEVYNRRIYGLSGEESRQFCPDQDALLLCWIAPVSSDMQEIRDVLYYTPSQCRCSCRRIILLLGPMVKSTQTGGIAEELKAALGSTLPVQEFPWSLAGVLRTL